MLREPFFSAVAQPSTMLVNRYFKLAFVTLSLGVLLFGDLSAVHSGVTSRITFRGQAAGRLALDGSGSGASDCTYSGGGAIGAGWVVVPTDQGSANGTFTFGTLSSGDGTLLTSTLGLRVRANSPCHITACVNQAAAVVPNAPRLVYQGTSITNATRLCQAFRLNTKAPLSGGANANIASYSSAGTLFTPARTLANLTNRATPLTTSSRFCRFLSPPSRGGTLTSADNYVEVYPQFTTNTGIAWGTSTGFPTTTFALNVIFGLFAN